jgi:hypothetical protein
MKEESDKAPPTAFDLAEVICLVSLIVVFVVMLLVRLYTLHGNEYETAKHFAGSDPTL